MDFSRKKKKDNNSKNEKEDGKIIEVCGGNWLNYQILKH